MLNVENKYFKFCLGTFCAIGGVFIIVLLLNSMMRGDVIEKPMGPPHNYWVPTEDDIQYIDSLHKKVQAIEMDVDTLHNSVDRIEQKIDHMIEHQHEINAGDVMNDIDTTYPDEHVMWISDAGDTIWE